MRVQAAAVVAGEVGDAAHEVGLGVGDPRGPHVDAAHRARRGVVVAADGVRHALEDRFRIVEDAAEVVAHHRGETTLEVGLDGRHAAAHEVKADAGFLHRAHLGVDQLARLLRHQVGDVDAGGGAREHQFGGGRQRRPVDGVGVEPRPQRIHAVEPVEDAGALGARHGAGQGLEEMMVRVDQPGRDDAALEVDALVGLGAGVGCGGDRGDDGAADQDVGAPKRRALARVHRFGAFEEEGAILAHGVIPLYA